MIEVLTGFPPRVVAVACRDQVTRADYETVLVPAVEAALKDHPKIRIYYRVEPGFSGFEPGAMWEDFKVGMQHILRWDRIAVVTDVDWMRWAVLGFRFVVPADLRVFPLAEAAEAEAWITSDLTA
jgi:hypothetical protein